MSDICGRRPDRDDGSRVAPGVAHRHRFCRAAMFRVPLPVGYWWPLSRSEGGRRCHGIRVLRIYTTVLTLGVLVVEEVVPSIVPCSSQFVQV